jgi:hypothetical protein
VPRKASQSEPHRDVTEQRHMRLRWSATSWTMSANQDELILNSEGHTPAIC